MTARARALFADGLREGGTWSTRTAAENLARFFAWRHWSRLEARRCWTFTPELTVELVPSGAAS